uniref:Anti-proliferative protein domain-containing protein n=1 Tax=Scophthalmus maximus TaxID=52904 RepID=A0A8D3E464_SCOMX
MKEEIAAAVFFVARLVKRYGSLDADSRDRFAAALTSVLFENYKNHWHPKAPSKGQAYRCLRMNRVRLQDPVLQQACDRSVVQYQDLGLPQELTVWVDPGEVSCRYGEHSAPFCVSVVDSCRRGDREFSRRIHQAVDSSSSSGFSSLSALCPAPIPEPKTIPTVSNPNSIYRVGGVIQTWLREKRKVFAAETFPPHAPPAGSATSQFSGPKGFKSYRATFTFTGPRVDKYHWVSKSRS